MAGTPARVIDLLGADLTDLTAAHIHQLVEGRVREDADIEFKEPLYGSTDSEKRDLAGDVAALANTVGGVLILGVKDDDGAAIGDPGVTLSETEELRMRHVLASNVAAGGSAVLLKRLAVRVTRTNLEQRSTARVRSPRMSPSMSPSMALPRGSATPS